ncbi:MAG: hypothetical protein WKF57_14455 [Nakamurella sp.]
MGPTHVEIDVGWHGDIVIDEHGIRQRGRHVRWAELHSIHPAAVRGQVNLIVRTDRRRGSRELALGRGGPDPHEVRAALLAVADAAGIEFPEEHWLERTLDLAGDLRTDTTGADAVRTAARGTVWYLDREPEISDTAFALSARVEVDPEVPAAERADWAMARGGESVAGLTALGQLGPIRWGRTQTIRD